MRPIQLTMQAFGSYGEKTTIDFEKPVQNLFLISGDTGSGKSTIFDALVFALYGEASSENNKKDGAELQSQYAGYTVDPFVELTFSEKENGEDRIYTIRREPRHQRQLKRRSSTGNSLKDVKETVSLILPDGREYSSNKKETDEKIGEIVSLTKSQFMQVAMIAQGEFMSTLRAKTTDKKETFRKLFHTELYQEVSERLGERRKEKKDQIDRIRTAFQTETSRIQIPADYEKAAELEEAKKRIRTAKEISVVDMETVTDLLPGLCEALKKQKDDAEQAQKAAEKARTNTHADYEKAKGLMAAFVSREKAQEDLMLCQAKSSEMKEKEKLGRKIQASYEIQAAHKSFFLMKGQLEDTIARKKDQEERLPQLKQNYETMSAAEKKAKEALDKENSAYGETKGKVDEALKNFREIRRTLVRMEGLKQDCLRKAQQTAAQKGDLDAFDVQVKKWRTEETRLSSADARMVQWKASMGECSALEQDAATCARMENDVERQRRSSDRAAVIYGKARNEYDRKQREYETRRKQYLDAQAGFIAKEFLKENEPCPVCGSIHHPSPCILAEEYKDLTREMIDELSGEVSRLEQAQSRAATNAGSALTALQEKKQHLQDALESLQSRMKQSIPETPDSLSSSEDAAGWILQLRSGLEKEEISLRADVKNLQTIRRSLSNADAQRETLNKACEAVQSEEQEAKQNYAEVSSSLTTLQSKKTYESEAQAYDVLAAATEKQRGAAAEHESAQNMFQKAITAKASAEKTIRDCNDRIPKLEKQKDQLEEIYRNLMDQYDLSEWEWRKITEENSKDRVDQLQREKTAYERKMASAAGELKAAQKTIGDQEKPDMDRLKVAEEEAQRQYEQSKDAFLSYNTLWNTNLQILQTLTPNMEKRQKAVSEYNRINGLYNRLSGNVTGSRMDIETFVQRYYLERILHSANARFLEMSAGQYELRLLSKEEAGDGKNRGLDLMVYSTVTGKERAVNTLSGGESFIAALSLALGMSDQIQAASAAIHPDIMFIDEGFGSLDDHAREEAVRVLKQMAGGSRLISIISHVTELKQEIDDQLLVTKDKNGSHIKWQIS